MGGKKSGKEERWCWLSVKRIGKEREKERRNEREGKKEKLERGNR